MNEVKKSGLDKTTVKDNEKYIANAVNVIFVRPNPENGKLQVAIHQRLAANKAGYKQWALPGGTQEAGETMEETAVREMQEEVGVTPTHIVFNNMFQCITEVAKPDGSVKLLHFNHFGYVCDEWKGEFKNTESDKHSDLEWCDIDELPLDNFFISKGNLINLVKGVAYSEEANAVNRLEPVVQKTL